MTVSQATAEVFLTALRALPEEERQAVLTRIAEDEQWREDLKDFGRFFSTAKRVGSTIPRIP